MRFVVWFGVAVAHTLGYCVITVETGATHHAKIMQVNAAIVSQCTVVAIQLGNGANNEVRAVDR